MYSQYKVYHLLMLLWQFSQKGFHIIVIEFSSFKVPFLYMSWCAAIGKNTPLFSGSNLEMLPHSSNNNMFHVTNPGSKTLLTDDVLWFSWWVLKIVMVLNVCLFSIVCMYFLDCTCRFVHNPHLLLKIFLYWENYWPFFRCV